MTTYGGVEVYLHAFLTSALDGGGWSTSRPASKRTPVTHLIGGWVGLRAGLDAVAKRNDLCVVFPLYVRKFICFCLTFSTHQHVSNHFVSLPTVTSRSALGPTQPPIQWVSRALSLRIKQPGRKADHSSPSSAQLKRKHWDNFTFNLYLPVTTYKPDDTPSPTLYKI
jgi:hypothetical protein